MRSSFYNIQLSFGLPHLGSWYTILKCNHDNIAKIWSDLIEVRNRIRYYRRNSREVPT